MNKNKNTHLKALELNNIYNFFEDRDLRDNPNKTLEILLNYDMRQMEKIHDTFYDIDEIPLNTLIKTNPKLLKKLGTGEIEEGGSFSDIYGDEYTISGGIAKRVAWGC